MGTGHESEHTKMVNKALRELSGQMHQPVSVIFLTNFFSISVLLMLAY
ncbi:Uncharacterised protein [Serratia fonticola]|nr:Uncharacterised protein [Serratia fonticola]